MDDRDFTETVTIANPLADGSVNDRSPEGLPTDTPRKRMPRPITPLPEKAKATIAKLAEVDKTWQKLTKPGHRDKLAETLAEAIATLRDVAPGSLTLAQIASQAGWTTANHVSRFMAAHPASPKRRSADAALAAFEKAAAAYKNAETELLKVTIERQTLAADAVEKGATLHHIAEACGGIHRQNAHRLTYLGQQAKAGNPSTRTKRN